MNHKQLLALFLFLVIITSSKIVSKSNNVIKVKDVNSNIDKYHIENIKEEEDGNKVNIFYPVTDYDNVNKYIMSKINYYKNEYNNSSYISDTKSLDISFEEFEYNDYTSFKFNINSNIGVNHDLQEVFTVVYKGNKLIDIEYLKDINNDILEILYNECYDKLKENNVIKQYSNDEWLEKGLKKVEDNYRNFIFTQNGMCVIFNEYTVAPYVAGVLNVEIPYEKLGNII